MVKTSLEKHKIKILLLEGIHQSAVERFNVAGYKNVEYHQGTFSESELIEKIGEYHFQGIGLDAQGECPDQCFPRVGG